jgi:hypothetical protein
MDKIEEKTPHFYGIAMPIGKEYRNGKTQKHPLSSEK